MLAYTFTLFWASLFSLNALNATNLCSLSALEVTSRIEDSETDLPIGRTPYNTFSPHAAKITLNDTDLPPPSHTVDIFQPDYDPVFGPSLQQPYLTCKIENQRPTGIGIPQVVIRTAPPGNALVYTTLNILTAPSYTHQIITAFLEDMRIAYRKNFFALHKIESEIFSIMHPSQNPCLHTLIYATILVRAPQSQFDMDTFIQIYNRYRHTLASKDTPKGKASALRKIFAITHCLTVSSVQENPELTLKNNYKLVTANAHHTLKPGCTLYTFLTKRALKDRSLNLSPSEASYSDSAEQSPAQYYPEILGPTLQEVWGNQAITTQVHDFSLHAESKEAQGILRIINSTPPTEICSLTALQTMLLSKPHNLSTAYLQAALAIVWGFRHLMPSLSFTCVNHLQYNTIIDSGDAPNLYLLTQSAILSCLIHTCSQEIPDDIQQQIQSLEKEVDIASILQNITHDVLSLEASPYPFFTMMLLTTISIQSLLNTSYQLLQWLAQL